MERTISHFTINREDENYILHFEDDNGETVELTASFDQLDLIAEAIDTALDQDEEAELGEDDEEEAEVAEDTEE
ncbi:hypothetical protein [Sandarakinorhabdus sp. DWP1-3-1]|uniref:hypothetical protein n=1 Tax=Sandarakinorhabdus sp. DWP1-3-1 TaxID=2804627 RepID=UPI003CED2FD0